ncbi:sialin-like [Oppia nitens]|uniref:sialin-like n=1 Tax=Oppia nitens TaxID=1686743 RepID=UPI0023DB786C|nr:sialin-like [Oppia nitens]
MDIKKSHWIYSQIPTRFVFVFFSFFGFVLAYAYKVVLSVAIVSMAGEKPKTNGSRLDDTCWTNDSFSASLAKSDHKVGEFSQWDDHTQAIILGAFFYGYIITQLPAGNLAEKFGGKWIFGGSILVAAILSLLSPMAARVSYVLFIAVRIGQGLALGVLFPCINAMISRWMPKMERSRGSTLVFTGSPIGTVITLPLAGVLCDSDFLDGWPSIFYVLGIAGCVWFVLWALLIHESPESHPYITTEEYEYIISDQQQNRNKKRSVTPWKDIWTSVPVYALIITHFGQNWGFLTILTLLPTYFEKVLNLEVKNNALMSALPYLCQAIVAWIASFISDKLRQRGTVSINVIRKTNNTIAFMGPALCLIGVAFARCNTTLSISLFILGMGLNGCNYPGFNSTHVDMAPEYSGTLMGITNSIGNIPGFIAPLVAEAFYEKGHTLTNWSYVFYLSAVIYIISALVYIVFASAELQTWGISREETIQFNKEKRFKNPEYNVDKVVNNI